MSQQWERWKRWMLTPWFRFVLVPLCLAGLVVLAELLVFHGGQLSLPAAQRSEADAVLEPVRREDLTDQERGFTMTEEQKQQARQMEPSENLYRIRVDQGYTNKLAIHLKNEKKENGYVEYTIKYRKIGSSPTDGLAEIEAEALLELEQDYTYIGESVDLLLIEIADPNVEVVSATLDNRIDLNGRRMLCMYAAVLTAYLLVVCRRVIGRKLEIGYLIIGLAAGLTWVLCLPPVTSDLSWDDGIHYNNANTLSYGQNHIVYSEAEHLELVSAINGVFDTTEDQAAYVAWANEQSEDYSQHRESYRSWELSDIGYTTQSLGIWLGRVLGQPFSVQFMLGRMGNMLLFVGVCYLAIKMAVRFKAVMATIALFPTVMCMAGAYAYDPTVIAFSLLGCSLFIAEMSRPDKLMDWKRGALMLAAFCIASFPKAVYIPMILLLLFLPKTKFADRRAHISFKVGVGLIFIIMMSSFVVPVFFVKGGGDVRGGNGVNTEAQLKFILSNPVAYAKVLVKSVLNVLDSFVINYTRMFLPYLSRGLTEQSPTYLLGTLNLISTGLMFYVLFTDKHKEKGTKELKGSTKWWMLVAVGGIVVLIWTALYLSFTPVAHDKIAGVQGRYYIPLLLLAAAILSPRHIKNETNPVRYNGLVLGLNALILFGCIWIYQITNFWL